MHRKNTLPNTVSWAKASLQKNEVRLFNEGDWCNTRPIPLSFSQSAASSAPFTIRQRFTN